MTDATRPDDVPARIEHTVLGPTTRWSDVRAVLETAAELGMRACVPPCYVADAAEYVPETTEDVPEAAEAEGSAAVPLTTVIDFPHGQGDPEAVVAAARRAWNAGADELDVVCNVGRLRAGEDDAVRAALADVVAAVPVPVKVIVQAPLLTDAELDRAGALAAEAGAAFLKTATGFGEGGATVADVERLARHLPVKASGGVGSWERARAMFDAGAERIGASSGDAIVREWRAATR